MAALTAQLATRELAVVLDNCEHVIDAAAALVRAIMNDCPGISILTTSREPLHLPGEIAWRVPSLRLPDQSDFVDASWLIKYESVQLFVARAQEAAQAFRLTDDNAPVVAHICHRLDGMPLAIELAAARAADLSPRQIAALLDDALTALGSRIRGTPDRQATLAATVAWSFDLLDADERQLFPRPSVFAGGFTLGRRRADSVRRPDTAATRCACRARGQVAGARTCAVCDCRVRGAVGQSYGGAATWSFDCRDRPP
ncbi:MAG TPA: hypothetical protein VI094_12310 [Propionibacteriaceae bacterium]